MQIDELSDAIMSTLKEYQDNIVENVDKIVEKTGKELRDELKQTSPKKSGDYSKGWRVTKVSDKKGNKVVVVNNKIYQLTHLLENGHANRNGGRTQAFPHIAPAEQKYIEEFIKEIEEAVNEAE